MLINDYKLIDYRSKNSILNNIAINTIVMKTSMMKINTTILMTQNKDMIRFIKTYFTLNEIANLAPISKIWRDTLSFSSMLSMIDPTDTALINAVNHIDKSLIKDINIQKNTDSRLAANIINKFFANMYAMDDNANVINDVDINKIFKASSKYDLKPEHRIELKSELGSDPKSKLKFKFKPRTINFYNSQNHNCNNINYYEYHPNSNDVCILSRTMRCVNATQVRPQTYKDLNNIEIRYDNYNPFDRNYYSIRCFYGEHRILIIYVNHNINPGSLTQKHIFNNLIESLALSQLRFLQIATHIKFSQDVMSYLHDIKKTNLKYLNLDTCPTLTSDSLKFISHGLEGNSLEFFAINECVDITDEDVEQLMFAIREMNLKYFNISICTNMANMILDPKKMSKIIKFLNFTHCGCLTHIGLKTILEGLCETKIESMNLAYSFSQLSLQNSKINNAVTSCLMKELKGTNIRHLNLSNSSLSEPNLRILIRTLKNYNIESFDLSGTEIRLTDIDLPYVLKMITGNW